MARLYAQLFTLVFIVVGIGGLFLGDASHVSNGQAGGNVGGLVLHFTWWRDVLDLAILALFVYVGFVASRHVGRLVVIAVGLVLVALGIAGFIIGDNPAATKGLGPLHFPLAVNVFDLVVGVLGVLSGLGTIEDDEDPAVSGGGAGVRRVSSR